MAMQLAAKTVRQEAVNEACQAGDGVVDCCVVRMILTKVGLRAA